MPEEKLDVVLNLRISQDDDLRLKGFGTMRRSQVARACLRMGLACAEADPTLLLSSDPAAQLKARLSTDDEERRSQ